MDMDFTTFTQYFYARISTPRTFDEWTSDNYDKLEKAFLKYKEVEEILNECE